MRTLIFVIAAWLIADAHATERSTKAVADFKRAHVCPATGVAKAAPCPGYVVDHKDPLCGDGKDAPENMVFMHVEDAKVKDSLERKYCSVLKKLRSAEQELSRLKGAAGAAGAAALSGSATADRPPMKGELK